MNNDIEPENDETEAEFWHRMALENMDRETEPMDRCKPFDRWALDRLHYAASGGLHPCYD